MYAVNFPTRGWTLGVPRSYEADGPFYLMLAQGLRRHGTYLDNPSLGYPYGQDLRDFPQGLDNLVLLVLRLLGFVAPPAVAVNLLLLLGAGLIGAITCVLLQRLGSAPATSVALAGIYATLPAHQVRHAEHLVLSSYWSVPLSCYIALRLMAAGDLLRRMRTLTGGLFACASILVIGSSGTYFVAFGLIVIALGAVFGTLRARAARPGLQAAAICAGVVVVAVANLLPTLLYWREHGRAESVIRRSASESIRGGLRPWEMLPGRSRPTATVTIEVAGSYIGIVACGALLVGLVVTIRWFGRSAEPAWALSRDATARDAIVLAIACAAFAAPRSGSYVVALSGFTWIREWHRMSIVVAFFAIVALARWLELARGRVSPKTGAAVLVAVALIAGADLVQYASVNAADRSRSARWSSDRQFFQEMQEDLPEGTAVVTLPYQQFPGFIGFGGVDAYDPAKGYIHAPDLRWEFGALYSRVPGPPANLGGDVACYARSIGAGAIVINLRSLPPGPGSVFDELRDHGLGPMGESPDGKLAWFDLTDWQGDCADWPAPA